MATHAGERAMGDPTMLDICWSCRAIWFDGQESAQLSPAGVVALFRAIHENTREPQPLAAAMRCPRCPEALALRQDLVRTGRIAYYRCLGGHGRLTLFNQFLIEKGFVRALRPAELATLRAQVAQVRCSGCGAPVDLVRDTACGHCRAPIAVLDADAVRKALATWSQAAAPAPPSSPRHDLVADLLMAHERERRRHHRPSAQARDDVLDLVAVGLAAVVHAFG